MKNACWLLIAVLVTLIASHSSNATTFTKDKFVCPIGGEKFTADVVMSYTSFGQRPDGKRYSTLPNYPIIECPKNGFLLFDENFTDEELDALRVAVQSDEYQRMRTTDTPHFRAYWLKEKAGRGALEKISSIIQAGWETEGDWDRKVRYKIAFIAEATGLNRSEQNATDWFWFNLRAANALRELGHFDQAADLIDRTYKPEFVPDDDEAAENAKFYVRELRALIVDENPLAEPANLIPVGVAAFRCIDPKPALTASEVNACAKEQTIKAIERVTAKDGGKKLTGEAAIKFLKRKREVVE